MQAASPRGCRGELVQGSSGRIAAPGSWGSDQRAGRSSAAIPARSPRSLLLLDEASPSLPARPDDPWPHFAFGLCIFARLGHSLEIRCAGPWQADKSFRSTTA